MHVQTHNHPRCHPSAQVLLCKLIDLLDAAVPWDSGPKFDDDEEPMYIPRNFRCGRTCVCVHVCSVCVCACMCVCVHVRVYACACVCRCVCVHAQLQGGARACLHVCMRACVCACGAGRWWQPLPHLFNPSAVLCRACPPPRSRLMPVVRYLSEPQMRYLRKEAFFENDENLSVPGFRDDTKGMTQVRFRGSGRG